MAKIVWNDSATQKLERHLDYAFYEFGRKCVAHWYRDILHIESRLSVQPLSYPKITLLSNRDKDYRGATIMRNFQLVYYYDAKNDIVYIDTIWDMRINPKKLQKEIT
jgi:plasmid stabilization system protein ParE